MKLQQVMRNNEIVWVAKNENGDDILVVSVDNAGLVHTDWYLSPTSGERIEIREVIKIYNKLLSLIEKSSEHYDSLIKLLQASWI